MFEEIRLFKRKRKELNFNLKVSDSKFFVKKIFGKYDAQTIKNGIHWR